MFSNSIIGIATPQTLVLLGILAFLACNVTGLVAIWGALGRPHWFLRIAVVGGLLLIWLAVPAHELILIFFVQSVVAIVPLAILRSRYTRRTHPNPGGDSPEPKMPPRKPQFSLTDLLLLTPIAAVISAVAASAPPEMWADWEELAFAGAVPGILTLIAAAIGLARVRFWMRMLASVPVFPSIVMIVWLELWRASSIHHDGQTRPGLHRLAGIGFMLLSLSMLLPLTVVYYNLITPTPIPQITLPEPNGYDELAQAGRAISFPVPEDRKATPALRSFVENHAHVLEMARSALDKPSYVPVDYHSPEMPPLRNEDHSCLMRAFVAEGRLAEAEGRTEDAIRSYLDMARLGKALTRGGLFVDLLVGNSMGGDGAAGLDRLRTSLTAQQARELLHALQSLDKDVEPIEDYLQRDLAWCEHALGWEWRLVAQLNTPDDDATMALDRENKRHQAKLRLVMCGIALRCYRLEQGHLPTTLAALVPGYLEEVPEDPFSGQPLVYRREFDGFLLYSWGPDERDDGGKPFNWFRQPNLEEGNDCVLSESFFPNFPEE